MIRYRKKLESGLQLMGSLETPKVDVAYLDFFAPDIRATDQRLPDLAVNASKAGDWGYISLSALVREIRFRTTTNGVSEAESAVGYGANLVGGFRLFKSEAKADVLYYQLIAGEGLGRYLVSLSGQNADAVPDPASGTLKAVPAFGGYVAYERRWTPQFFSTLIGGGNILKNQVAPTLADRVQDHPGHVQQLLPADHDHEDRGRGRLGAEEYDHGDRGGGSALLPRRPLRLLGDESGWSRQHRGVTS